MPHFCVDFRKKYFATYFYSIYFRSHEHHKAPNKTLSDMCLFHKMTLITDKLIRSLSLISQHNLFFKTL